MTRWGENRPPKGKGGPRFGSVDKGWCCHERGLNDSEFILSTKLGLFPDHPGRGYWSLPSATHRV
jgi:hypothetical protein